LLAINHREPDRVPIRRPNIISTSKPLDERVQRFLNSFEFDQLLSFDNFIKSPSARQELHDGIFEDSYGCQFKYKRVGSPYCIRDPLAHVRTIKDVEKFNWPDVDAYEFFVKNACEKAREMYEKSEYATVINVDVLFHRYQWLRGFTQWLLDIKLNPKLHKAIADRIYYINLTLAMRLLNEVGKYTDIVKLSDDFGTSRAPFMSPQDFRIHVKSYFKDFIGRVKKQFPHVKFYLHSHGQIMDLIPDLIDCGIDILNPILPLDNMDPVRLKREFGSQLAFEGGIDVEHVLIFGTVDEVKEHVKRVIDILAPGGGFIFKVQAISPLIPYENLSTAYKLAAEYGRYDK